MTIAKSGARGAAGGRSVTTCCIGQRRCAGVNPRTTHAVVTRVYCGLDALQDDRQTITGS